jgi:hypothetical protein
MWRRPLVGFLVLAATSLARAAEPAASDDAHPAVAPLVLTAGTDGYAVLDVPAVTGRPYDQPVEVVGFLGHNPPVTRRDHGFVAVPLIDDEVPVNQGIDVAQGRDRGVRGTLRLRPGYHYLDTNYGKLRIVVLDPKLTETERFLRLFYFYTSTSALGRSADRFMGPNAVRILFHSDLTPGNYCTGHANFFISVFERYVPRMRRVDFFAMRRGKDGARALGHSTLEVFVDGRWMLADPLYGFVPVDRVTRRPLSFVEFRRKLPHHGYLLMYRYRVPIMPRDREYLAKPPLDVPLHHMDEPRVVADAWDPTVPVVFRISRAPATFYALPEDKARMSDADWALFAAHYDPVVRRLQDPKVAASVRTDVGSLY